MQINDRRTKKTGIQAYAIVPAGPAGPEPTATGSTGRPTPPTSCDEVWAGSQTAPAQLAALAAKPSLAL